jgi:hypothetical protein
MWKLRLLDLSGRRETVRSAKFESSFNLHVHTRFAQFLDL